MSLFINYILMNLVALNVSVAQINPHGSSRQENNKFDQLMKKMTKDFISHYSDARFIVKCQIVNDGAFIKYRIIKVYKGINIQEISKNSILKISSPKDKHLMSTEAVVIYYPNEKGELWHDTLYILEGIIGIGDHEIDPDLLPDKQKVIDILSQDLYSQFKKAQKKKAKERAKVQYKITTERRMDADRWEWYKKVFLVSLFILVLGLLLIYAISRK